MTCANAKTATNVRDRKRPFRARKRVLSARANSKRDQPLETGPAQVEFSFHKNFSLRVPVRKSKGGAPRGNTNRLTHGKYTREKRSLYARIRAHIRAGREIVARAKLMAAEQTAARSIALLRQHPVEHGIASGFDVVPARDDLLVGRDDIGAGLAERVPQGRGAHDEMRVWKPELARLLIGVGLLADRLAGEDRIGLVLELGGVVHRGGERLRADQHV